MPKFLTTTGVSSEIENIIRGAKNKLALVSPYLKLSQNFYERLRDADKRNVSILIVYGKEELNNTQISQLSDLKNLKLFFCTNLHAKCYMNETSCVITSMNMYEFSEKNNREIGILFSRSEDQSIFNETVEEIRSIMENSTNKNISELNSTDKNKTASPIHDKPAQKSILKDQKPVHQPSKNQFANSFFGGILSAATNLLRTDGFCLRCGTKVNHDVDKPFCPTCYQQWAIYGNIDYPENNCHTCGKTYKTSFAKPECRNCYSS